LVRGFCRNLVYTSTGIRQTVWLEAVIHTFVKKLKFTPDIDRGDVIVSTLPILLVYPFIQKYFEKGVMIGSVKG
jgi:ABC-type glycerol-3-phosphate transport system permease component